MMQNLVQVAEKAFQNSDRPMYDFKVGDTICVHVKIQERNKERIQQFQGVVLKIAGHKGHVRNVTVRKTKNQISVERIFPMPSSMIADVEVKQRGIVRQSRILYLRHKKGSGAKIKHKIG